jgi:hypothetical protein
MVTNGTLSVSTLYIRYVCDYSAQYLMHHRFSDLLYIYLMYLFTKLVCLPVSLSVCLFVCLSTEHKLSSIPRVSFGATDYATVGG